MAQPSTSYNYLLYLLLRASGPVADIVGDRIYPVTIDQDQIYPALCYTKTVTPVDVKHTPVINPGLNPGEVVTYRIHCFANQLGNEAGADVCDRLARTVRQALDRVHGQVDGKFKAQQSHFISQTDEGYDNEYQCYFCTVTIQMNVVLLQGAHGQSA